MNRFKSPVLWSAIVALLAFILGNYGLYDKIGLTDESFKQLANLIFAVLVALGIINNPTDNKSI